MGSDREGRKRQEEGRLALIPSNLPDVSVAQPETSGHHILPPHNKALLETVAAEGIVVTEGDAPGRWWSVRCVGGRRAAARILDT